ncbi:MAG: hypothetical protein E6J91_15110 [Deltaproteobacteria bacterium]|nr:MAG: hypothetical protein E6J91_15110 [Deltaproteobacteria bacterium]
MSSLRVRGCGEPSHDFPDPHSGFTAEASVGLQRHLGEGPGAREAPADLGGLLLVAGNRGLRAHDKCALEQRERLAGPAAGELDQPQPSPGKSRCHLAAVQRPTAF